MAGVLNFDLYMCILATIRKAELIFEIKITGLDKKFDFRCENIDIYEAWVSALEF